MLFIKLNETIIAIIQNMLPENTKDKALYLNIGIYTKQKTEDIQKNMHFIIYRHSNCYAVFVNTTESLFRQDSIYTLVADNDGWKEGINKVTNDIYLELMKDESNDFDIEIEKLKTMPIEAEEREVGQNYRYKNNTLRRSV